MGYFTKLNGYMNKNIKHTQEWCVCVSYTENGRARAPSSPWDNAQIERENHGEIDAWPWIRNHLASVIIRYVLKPSLVKLWDWDRQDNCN